jgi:dipeptidyl aminopeptidase/acylaminoacyl peptidase
MMPEPADLNPSGRRAGATKKRRALWAALAVVGVVVIAAGLAPWVVAWGQLQSEVDEYLATPGRFEPWNSERRTLEARTAAQPVHKLDHGLAVSPDGKLVAVSAPAHSVNQLLLLDIQARRSWVLKHPIPRVGLIQPAFSSKGDRLAFVVAVPAFTGEYIGTSEIWITDLRGQVERVISSPGRMHEYPAFSPDGERLAFFRDVDPHRPLKNTRWVPHENRQLKPRAIYELDLGSGAETRLSDTAFGGIFKLSYAPDGRSLTFVFVTPLRPVRLQGATGWLFDLDAEMKTYVFSIVRGRSNEVEAVPHTEASLSGGGFAGYANGRLILLHSTFDAAARAMEHRVLAVDRAAARTWFMLGGLHGRYLNQAAVSAQGRLVALENGVVGQKARFPGPNDMNLVVADPEGPTTSISIERFRAEPTAISLGSDKSQIRETPQ